MLSLFSSCPRYTATFTIYRLDLTTLATPYARAICHTYCLHLYTWLPHLSHLLGFSHLFSLSWFFCLLPPLPVHTASCTFSLPALLLSSSGISWVHGSATPVCCACTAHTCHCFRFFSLPHLLCSAWFSLRFLLPFFLSCTAGFTLLLFSLLPVYACHTGFYWVHAPCIYLFYTILTCTIHITHHCWFIFFGFSIYTHYTPPTACMDSPLTTTISYTPACTLHACSLTHCCSFLPLFSGFRCLGLVQYTLLHVIHCISLFLCLSGSCLSAYTHTGFLVPCLPIPYTTFLSALPVLCLGPCFPAIPACSLYTVFF